MEHAACASQQNKIREEVPCQAGRLLQNPVIAGSCMCTMHVCHVSVCIGMHVKARGRCWAYSSIIPPYSFLERSLKILEFAALARLSGRCHAQGHDDLV